MKLFSASRHKPKTRLKIADSKPDEDPGSLDGHPSRIYTPPERYHVPPEHLRIVPAIDKALVACARDGAQPYMARARKDEPRKTFVVHPSEAGGCPRALGFSILGAPQDLETHDARMLRVFDVGHVVHRRLQGYLWEAKLRGIGGITNVWEDVAVKLPELVVAGELDCIIEISGKWRFVVEIKSMKHDQFKALRAPKTEWIWQVHLYMACTGIRAAYLLVEDKDTQDLVEFFVPFDPALMQKIAARIRNVLAVMRKKKLPSVDLNHCYFCRYKGVCPVKAKQGAAIPWKNLKQIAKAS